MCGANSCSELYFGTKYAPGQFIMQIFGDVHFQPYANIEKFLSERIIFLDEKTFCYIWIQTFFLCTNVKKMYLQL
jgi:hypothetical protein